MCRGLRRTAWCGSTPAGTFTRTLGTGTYRRWLRFIPCVGPLDLRLCRQSLVRRCPTQNASHCAHVSAVDWLVSRMQINSRLPVVAIAPWSMPTPRTAHAPHRRTWDTVKVIAPDRGSGLTPFRQGPDARPLQPHGPPCTGGLVQGPLTAYRSAESSSRPAGDASPIAGSVSHFEGTTRW